MRHSEYNANLALAQQRRIVRVRAQQRRTLRHWIIRLLWSM